MTLLTLHHRPRSRSRSELLDNRYQLRSQLGAGATCEVWQATDRHRDTEVAIKLLKDELDEPEWHRRLLREGEILACFDHLRIVHLLQINREQPFLVLELLPGTTLRQIDLRRDVQEVARMIVQICSALMVLNRAGFVHRDVKPGNIMIHNGNATLIDFSITRECGRTFGLDDLTMTGNVMGTVGYFSPEQAGGKIVGTASDIFSLGILAFEQLTGQHPFRVNSQSPVATASAIAREEPMHLSDIRKDLRSLEPRISAMLAKDPEDRPTLEEIQVAFLGFLPAYA